MTQGQFDKLSQAGENFKLVAACMDFSIQDVEGPSEHGAYLVREINGKVWLFGKSQGKLGRRVVPSVWTPLNIAVMRGQNPPDDSMVSVGGLIGDLERLGEVAQGHSESEERR